MCAGGRSCAYIIDGDTEWDTHAPTRHTHTHTHSRRWTSPWSHEPVTRQSAGRRQWAEISDVVFVIQLALSARVGLHDPTAAHGHVYAVHDGGDVARSGGRPRILILHAQVPRTTGIQDYAHNSLPSGAEPVTTGLFCLLRSLRCARASGSDGDRVARRVGTLALRVRGIGVFEGKEGFKGEPEGSAAHQANDAKHRQARAEVHAACVAVHVGPAAASSRSEKASATRGSGWGEAGWRRHRVCTHLVTQQGCVCSDSGGRMGAVWGRHWGTPQGDQNRDQNSAECPPHSSATARAMNSARERGVPLFELGARTPRGSLAAHHAKVEGE